jgi:hypothetical protein
MEEEMRRTTAELARMSEELVRTRQESRANQDYLASYNAQMQAVVSL